MREASEGDDDRGHDDSDGAQQVPEDLEVGAAHVQAAGLGTTQDQHRDEIGHSAHDRHGQHEAAGDFGWLVPTLPSLPQDEGCDPEQDDGVDDSGQDLGTVPAEGASITGGASGEPDGSKSEGDSRHVGKDVAGVCQERQTVGQEPTDQLQEQDGHPDAEDEVERTSVLLCRTTDVVAAHRSSIARGSKHAF